jgi:hypothetical protein
MNPRPKLRTKAPLSDRVMLWLSSGKRIDGLWVGTYFQTNAGSVMRRVEEALRLIKTHEGAATIASARTLPVYGFVSSPERWHGTCLTRKPVNSMSALCLPRHHPPELIAAAIVHEATHARLWRCGIGYDEELRARVEAACFRRELAFAAKLPNGERVQEQARDALAIPPATWTDTAERDRNVDGSTEVLHHLGAPNGLVRALLAARAWRSS